jgi:hypothetical protein
MSIKAVSVETTIVLVTATVPVAAKETVPPPSRAAKNELREAFVTTPAPGARMGRAMSPTVKVKPIQFNVRFIPFLMVLLSKCLEILIFYSRFLIFFFQRCLYMRKGTAKSTNILLHRDGFRRRLREAILEFDLSLPRELLNH